jgi:hypothetical protein
MQQRKVSQAGRVWDKACLVVAIVAFIVPVVVFVLQDADSRAAPVAPLFVGLAALGARSSVAVWLDPNREPATLIRWVVAGVLVGVGAAGVGAVLALNAFEMPFPPAGAAVLALVMLSVVHLQVHTRKRSTTATLLNTTILNGVIAWAAGYELATGLLQWMDGGTGVLVASILVALLCGGGIGGWRYRL